VARGRGLELRTRFVWQSCWGGGESRRKKGQGRIQKTQLEGIKLNGWSAPRGGGGGLTRDEENRRMSRYQKQDLNNTKLQLYSFTR